MNLSKLKIARLFLLLVFTLLSFSNFAQFQYISPKPGSKYHKPETNIILKNTNKFNHQTIDFQQFNISGSVSGNHEFNFKLTDDLKTIILNPMVPFLDGEIVEVTIADGIKLENGSKINPQIFHFTISENSKIAESIQEISDTNSKIEYSETDLYLNFPSITVNVNDNPDEGKIFFHNISALASDSDRYYAIIENDGTPFYAKQDNQRGLSFTLQKNGYLTYWNKKNFYMLDSSYSLIDSFACGNGYDADWHELQVLENGHAFLIAWDLQIVDMSQVVTGGQEYATVEGLIIQEIDENKDVVFQWRSWDHFEITDAIDVDFTTSYVSYSHGNALEIDSDTSLLVSLRLMNEVTKINRITGEIIWRLGGKNNEFTFIDDSCFCRQHDIRRLSNGHITVFDNGGCHNPQISAAKEYELDEINKTAQLVWKYEHPTKMYCETMGNVQRLPNGNTFINWGRLPDSGMTGPDLLPAITEVLPDKSIVYELTFNTFFHMAYRSYRFQWDVNPPTLIVNPFENKPSLNVNYYPNPAKDILNISITINEPEKLTISVLNSCGIIIDKISNYTVYKGVNTIKMDTQMYKSGLYFCMITSEKYYSCNKLIITK